jgi:hypothetical protein
MWSNFYKDAYAIVIISVRINYFCDENAELSLMLKLALHIIMMSRIYYDVIAHHSFALLCQLLALNI